MRPRCAAVLVLVVAWGVVPATAKLPASNKLALVQAQCAPPLPALPGPCSPHFTFASGTAVLKGAKEPTPTCPRTNMPEETPAGDVKLLRVTKDGAPFTGQLTLQGVLKTTFGVDPNGNCALAGVQIETPSLMGTVSCKKGTCKGALIQAACLPKTCADTPIVSEFGRVELNGPKFGPILVLDDAQLPLATPGTILSPARSDAP